MLALTRQERLVLVSLSLMIFTGSLLHLAFLRFPRARDLMRFIERDLQLEKLDLNAVTAEDLVKVPYIGEVLAGRILEYRRVNGPFRDPKELLQVHGVGPHNYQQFIPYFKIKDR